MQYFFVFLPFFSTMWLCISHIFLMYHFIDYVLAFTEGLGYLGIFIMMSIEASFLPLPSELILIPAGHLVFLWEMNFFLLLLSATAWVLLGSWVNYLLWYYLGGPILKKMIHKYGKYIFLQESHYTASEKFFLKHGEISTFVGRFIPGVRSLISFPPGIFKMSPLRFSLYTLFAGTIANTLLIGVGYIAGQNEALIKKLTSELMLVVIVFCGTLISLYIWYVKSHKKELRKIEAQIEENFEVEEKEIQKEMEKQEKKKHKKHSKKK